MEHQIVHGAFERLAVTQPERIALRHGEKEVSYAVLNERAELLAGTLQGLGLEKGTVVGVLLAPGIDLVAAMLACFKAGLIYMPVDMAFGRRRLQEMLRHCDCSNIITDAGSKDRFLALIDELKIGVDHVIVTGTEKCGNAGVEVWGYQAGVAEQVCVRDARKEYAAGPEDSIYIFCTSGTTGESKAILGSHKSLSHFINWEIAEFGINAEFRVSQLTSVTFDASLRDVFAALTAGGTVCIPAEEVRVNPAALAAWIRDSRITLIHCVPSLFKLLTRELASRKDRAGVALPDLKHILMAGEPLYGKDISLWYEAAGRHTGLVALYGTTETTLCKTFHRIGEAPANPAQLIHAGKPIEGAQVLIVNNGQLCRIGEIGEIYIRTPYRTKGYYNNQALTDAVFVQNPLSEKPDIVHKTGDMGKYLADRSIEIIGRLDDQIKIGGVRVELREVEQAVLSYPAIRETTVIAHKGQDGEYELICYYVGDEFLEEALRTYLEREMVRNTVPAFFVKLDAFPLTINGKVDKKALPKPSALYEKKFDYEAPANDVERGLQEIWEEVLGIKQIGRNVSFFEIGGNSLKSLLMISRIYKTYEVLVKLDVIFTQRTIAGIAGHIAEARKQSFRGIQVLEEKAHYEVSNSQQRAWIQHQSQEEKSLYNVAGAYRFDGDLDLAAFRRAFASLVERHEALRTSFLMVGGELRQRINAYDVALHGVEYIDLTGSDSLEEIETIVAGISNRVFDLERGPLFKAALMRLAERRFVLAITMHHIISDAWSMEILTSEIFQLYKAYRDNLANPLAPLRIQYKDYASWQNRLLSSEELSAHRSFWAGQFRNMPPALNLPLSGERPASMTYEAGTTSFTMPNEVRQALVELSLKADATLFMMFVALLNIVLYRYSSEPDITIGAPVAGREHPDLENQVGFYVNTVPVRTKIEEGISFAGHLSKVRELVVEILKYQAYPFDRIVDDTGFVFARNRNPLFDVGFTYIKENELAEEGLSEGLEGIDVSYIGSGFNLIKTDLWFKVLDYSGAYIMDVSYNKGLFTPAFIDKLIGGLRYLTETVIAHPEYTLAQLVVLLKDRERLQEEERIGNLKIRNLESLRHKVREVLVK